MTDKVNNLLTAATNDKEFQEELKVHEPKHYKVGLFNSNNEKIMYASIYMGWLIGKGKYNENDFLLPPVRNCAPFIKF